MKKKCKHCAMMIPKEAKVCPHCRKKQGWPLAVKLILILLGLYLLGQSIPSNTSYTEKATQAAINYENSIQLTEAGKKVRAKHPDWANDVCNTIAEKKIRIGMTQGQVTAAWGKPHRVNTTITANTKHEQWVMSDSISSDYLYFANGVLTSFQQHK